MEDMLFETVELETPIDTDTSVKDVLELLLDDALLVVETLLVLGCSQLVSTTRMENKKM